MQKITENEWIKLSEISVFFGHQSVGNNIINGLFDLKHDSNSTAFDILETKDKLDFQHTLFAHSAIGNNYDPKSKIEEFTNIMKSGLADSVDVAFMKLCYVDINRNTNIEELFKYYQSSINSLQEKYPRLKIIHFTVPLVTKPRGLKGIIKKILKMDDNPYRNKFNELIRNCYINNEIFDIAKIESTYPNGTVNTYNKSKVIGLISEYSSDGGHLNQYGRVLVANELVIKLLEIADSTD